MEPIFCPDEPLVYPWMAVMANVSSNVTSLKNELSSRGFSFLKVKPVWDSKGFPTYAVVEFHHNLVGLYKAIKFEKAYSDLSHGKKDYFEVGAVGGEPYCWIAGRDDFCSDRVGKYLRKRGDLMTVSDYVDREKRKDKLLFDSLTMKLKEQKVCLKELENIYGQVSTICFELIDENDKILKAEGSNIEDEMKKVEQDGQDLKNIESGIEKDAAQVEADMRPLKKAKTDEH